MFGWGKRRALVAELDQARRDFREALAVNDRAISELRKADEKLAGTAPVMARLATQRDAAIRHREDAEADAAAVRARLHDVDRRLTGRLEASQAVHAAEQEEHEKTRAALVRAVEALNALRAWVDRECPDPGVHAACTHPRLSDGVFGGPWAGGPANAQPLPARGRRKVPLNACGSATPDGPCGLAAGHPVGPMYPGHGGHQTVVIAPYCPVTDSECPGDAHGVVCWVPCDPPS